MPRSEEKNRPFEAMLSRSLESTRGNGVECPDPATIAAYYERRLARAERAACEHHFASCARCQAQLAAIAKTDPGGGSPGRRWAWAPDWRFTIPIGAAAAAVIVIALTSVMRTRTERPPLEVASAPEARRPVANEAPNAAPPPPAEAAKTAQPTGHNPSPPAARDALQEREQKASAPSPRAAVQKQREEQTVTPQEYAAATSKATTPSVPSISSEHPETAETVTTKPQNQVTQPEASPTQGLLARLIHRSSQGSVVASGAAVGAAPTAAYVGGGATASLGQRERTQWTSIPAPDGKARWRIGPQGQIIDAVSGARQFTGISADLIAGAAPSDSVCWLIGHPNVILRTIDGGTHWELTGLPAEASELTAVHAQDADSARVSTSSGRNFVTSDGGKSWRPD